MQVGGIGNSGLNNHGSSHHVTGCLHDHQTDKAKTGGMRASSFSLSETSQNTTREIQGGSLMDTLKNAVSRGLGLWNRLWHGGQGNSTQETSMQSNAATQVNNTTLQQADVHQPTVAAAASSARVDARFSDNPYFTTTSDPGRVKESLSEKIRIKLRDLTGQLTKRFGGRFGDRMSGNFAGKNALASGQHKPKEDLRRHSRYKEDELEVDCVLTDDSYLMDSYDRRGEYTKLTTDYKGQDKTSV